MKITKKILFFNFIFVIALVSGCKFYGSDINQSSICQTETPNVLENTKNCSIGEKIIFTPPTFGNEQYPVVFVAGNCDLRYSVAMTNGAVACIFSPAKISE